jgi:hypothetical protein
MNNMTWMLVRYGLIAVGTFLASKGWIAGDVGGWVDELQGPLGAIIGGGAALWGVIVNKNAAIVPAQTAQRNDVPTLSPITGQQIPGRVKDHL